MTGKCCLRCFLRYSQMCRRAGEFCISQKSFTKTKYLFSVKKNGFEHVVNFYSPSINTDLDLLLLCWLRVKKIPHDKVGNKFDSCAVLRSCCHHEVLSPK